MSQLALNLSPLSVVAPTPHLSIAEQFAIFHAVNPHVADALETLAAQWLERHDRVGMKALFERLRWESGIQTAGEAWRLNNNYTALYGRLLIDRRPEWADAITTRELRAA